MSNSSKGLFDCSQKVGIGLMQVDLKFRFCIRISLVNWITPLSPRSRNRTPSCGACKRRLSPFL